MLIGKAANTPKRVARPRVVELNGPAERIELLLLIFMAPLWGIVFPLIGLSTLASYAGATLLGASFFCFLHFLHLNNSSFSFEEKGVRLPGVDHRVLPYANVQRIYLEKLSPLLLAIEFVPLPNIWSKKEGTQEPCVQLFEIQHLTEEGARELWTLFASYLRSCNISLDVRDRLVNWRTKGSEEITANIPAAKPAAGEPTAAPAAGASNLRGAEIARDLSMVIPLKRFDPIKLIGQYMMSYSDTFRKTWLTCWTAVGAFAYPITIYGLLSRPLIDRQIIQEGQAASAETNGKQLGDWLANGGQELTHISTESLTNFFGNHLGAIGLFVLLTFVIIKIYRIQSEPDELEVDYMGITTQKRMPNGTKPMEHRSWKTIESIKLLRPHEKTNSSRWSIVFESNQEKNKVAVPFKAFASERVRQQFIECLDTWGRNINTDPDLLEALAPRGQASYTELWLSALAEAPKIDSLTPHSAGLKLQSRAYEIERQLASGGQGVAYLARKLKAGAVAAAPAESAAECATVESEEPKTEATENASSEATLPKLVEVEDADKKDAGVIEEGKKDAEKEVADKAENETHAEPAVKLVVSDEPVTEGGADAATVDDGAEYEQVVLKETVLPIYVDDRARAKALSRFERDAKLLASLNHPLIVKLDDYFVENNRAYLALEYINGKTLKDKVDTDGPMSEEEVRRLALMMADILHYLHNREPQVVHRDFTPDNLMLTEDGKIKLIDFDVAMEQSAFSQTNATIVGKQAYIPLEQFRGKPSSQSDIYALGATLAFLLTGMEPAALQASHPREVRTDISHDLDDIIGRATAIEVADRIETAAALRELLELERHKAASDEDFSRFSREQAEEYKESVAAVENGGDGNGGDGNGGNGDRPSDGPSIKIVVAESANPVKEDS